MRNLLILAVVSLPIAAQQPNAPTDKPPVATLSDAHKSAVELVEVTGMRQQLLDHKAESVKAGQDAIRQNSPAINPAFVDEWGKRMLAQYNVDAFLAVAVHVYEAHFTNDELRQLIQAQLDAKASKPVTLSPQLKQKLTENMSAIQSEIIGGCSQVGAKAGADIGQQLQKEHPEWFPEPASASPKP
jgi:hypothetical protein